MGIAKFLIDLKYYYCSNTKFQYFKRLEEENPRKLYSFRQEKFCFHQKSLDKAIKLEKAF